MTYYGLNDCTNLSNIIDIMNTLTWWTHKHFASTGFMSVASLHDARSIVKSWTVTMSGKHVITLVDPWHGQITSTSGMLDQYPLNRNMWWDHLTYVPTLTSGDWSPSAHNMHKDTVNKTRQQVCWYCLRVFNYTFLLVCGRVEPNWSYQNSVSFFVFFVSWKRTWKS